MAIGLITGECEPGERDATVFGDRMGDNAGGA